MIFIDIDCSVKDINMLDVLSFHNILDSRSEVSCGINFMRIEIDRKYFDPAKYSRISLKDESCKSTLSKTKIVLDSAPQKCGSTKVENDNYIIYQNEVYMKAIPTGKIVTREHDVRVTFSCSYNKSGMVSIQAFTPITIVDVKEGILQHRWENHSKHLVQFCEKS